MNETTQNEFKISPEQRREHMFAATADAIRQTPRNWGEKRQLAGLEFSTCEACGTSWEIGKTNCKNCGNNTSTSGTGTGPEMTQVLNLYKAASILVIDTEGGIFNIPPGVYERILINGVGIIVKSSGKIVVLDDIVVGAKAEGILLRLTNNVLLAPGAELKEFGVGTINKANLKQARSWGEVFEAAKSSEVTS